MFAFLAPAALRLFAGRAAASVKNDWNALSPKFKLALVGVLLAIALFFLHQHQAHRALEAQYKAGYDRAIADVAARQAKIDKAARARKARIDSAAVTITTKAEVHHEQAVADIASDARALRLRRPPGFEPVRITGGALPGFPDAAGGRDGAAAGEVSGLAQIPWIPLVDHGELCDVDRAKLDTLQGWIRAQAELNKKELAR